MSELIWLGLLGACVGEEESILDLEVIAGCESESYAACDVLAESCQDRVFRTMSCLRELPAAARPAIRTITSEEYRAELTGDPSDAEESEGDEAMEGNEPPADPSDEEINRSVERALVLLGLAQPADLAPETVIEFYTETVPGYYSSEDKRVTLISDPSRRSSPGDATSLLAHEYLHALQDQEVDLITIGDDDQTFDQFLATRSVVEGEASMFQSFFDAAMWRLEGDVDFGSHFTSWVPNSEERYAGRSPLVAAPRYFPYSYGARYVYERYSEEGIAAIRALYTNMPSSVLPMLLESTSADDGTAEAVAESLALLAPPAPAIDFELVTQDTLGPWVFAKFLQRSLPESAVVQLMSRWRGDRFFVYSRASTSVTGIWSLQLDDAAAVDQFRAAAVAGNANLSPSAFVVSAGRNVAVTVMDEPSYQSAWLTNIEQAQLIAQTPPDTASPEPDAAGAPPISRAVRQRWVARLGQE